MAKDAKIQFKYVLSGAYKVEYLVYCMLEIVSKRLQGKLNLFLWFMFTNIAGLFRDIKILRSDILAPHIPLVTEKQNGNEKKL
jgi:hypothetical protein